LGLTGATAGTLSREGFNSEQCLQQWDAVWQAKACNSKQTKRTTVSSNVLLHNSAHLHTAARTVETLKKLCFEVLEHCPCSPDLAPLDCHLFGPLKQALRGHRFITDQQIMEMVHAWLVLQPKTFILRA
jgi:hypothetical protein